MNTPYWNQSLDELFTTLDTTQTGLTAAQAHLRLEKLGLNTLKRNKLRSTLALFLNQFKNPLILILMFAVIISALAGEWVDAGVVIVVVIGSAVLSFVQEYNASNAVEKLMARIELKADVLRDSVEVSIPDEQVVPGDVVLLRAGDLIPGDGRVLQAKDCYVDQAALTGETFPVEKLPGTVETSATLTERTNCVYMGTSVRSGTATMLVVYTGSDTDYGQIAQRLTLRPPETEFERGIRRFGYLLVQIILGLVLFVFAINVFAARPAVDSLLFAIALAVGIAPELLPAIITITLSTGAQQMAAHGVIVRRLNAIENFGNMDVLCTDKTGTLTEGLIQLNGAFDTSGELSNDVLLDAYLNAHFQVGMVNPLDEAIITGGKALEVDFAAYRKIDEVPYDFIRKRLSIIVETPNGIHRMIIKGALANVLEVCNRLEINGTVTPLNDEQLEAIDRRYVEWSAQGFRVLGLATKSISQPQEVFAYDDENDMVFTGFLLFFDPPKEDVRTTLTELAGLGVNLKIITGDNHEVAQYVAKEVGLPVTGILTGRQLNQLTDDALWSLAERTNLFVEVDPSQKERIIRALRATGHVVGYMGDGINDAPALHIADVGISVDQAVDVAKEAADFVLLEHSLSSLREGILYGRKTFANTIKYIFTTTSANFGNMFSMAGLSLFLPFLPLLAKQILLNNFLSDFPGMAIASDNVDQEWIDRPRRWDMKYVRNFMVIFGLVSSLFDFLTFGMLLWLVQASPEEFRTGWFIESLMTELVIALVVRTRRPFFRSRPGKWLWISTLLVAILTITLPYLPVFNTLFNFTPLPATTMLLLLLITGLYIMATEVVKSWFYARFW